MAHDFINIFPLMKRRRREYSNPDWIELYNESTDSGFIDMNYSPLQATIRYHGSSYDRYLNVVGPNDSLFNNTVNGHTFTNIFEPLLNRTGIFNTEMFGEIENLFH